MTSPRETAPQLNPTPAWRLWAGRVAMILAGLAAGFLLIEILLRVTARMDLLPVTLHDTLNDVRLVPWGDDTIVPPKLVRTDSYFGSISRQAEHYRWQVGGSAAILDLTTINWLDRNSHIGFRVPSTDWQPRWPVDAVVLGDSFTFCFTEYDDCWVSRLQSDYGLSVVNLGLPATGSVSHQRVLDTFGLSYKPRIVIWQWWGNDSFENSLLQQISNPKPGRGEALGPCATISPFEQWFNHYSALGGMVHELRCGYDPQTVDPYRITSDQLNLTFGSTWFRSAFDMSTKDNKRGWPSTQDALLASRKLAEDNGGTLVVVLIPSKEEAYASQTGKYLGADGLAVYSQGRQMMLDFCKEQGLTCFDSTPALSRHADQGEQVYWPSDIHLNPEGNKVLAAAVDEYLKTQGLVK